MKKKIKKSDVDIDLHHLEVDCSEHARKVIYWGLKLTRAKRLLAKLENKKKLFKAKKARSIRHNPRSYYVKEVTQGAIEDICSLDEEYKEMIDKILNLEGDIDELEKMMKALSEKGMQLSNIVKLIGHMYWAKPDTSIDKEANKAITREANRRIEENDD